MRNLSEPFCSAAAVRLLMEQIPIEATNGLRDYVMLMLMYTTGIRVSELISIKVRDLSLSSPYTLLVHGKGQKSRFVPLISKTVPVIKRYLREMGYDNPSRMDDWLFINHMGGQFTRQGVSYLIKKYADDARKISPDLIPMDMSPHKMRHTAAMGCVHSVRCDSHRQRSEIPVVFQKEGADFLQRLERKNSCKLNRFA